MKLKNFLSRAIEYYWNVRWYSNCNCCILLGLRNTKHNYNMIYKYVERDVESKPVICWKNVFEWGVFILYFWPNVFKSKRFYKITTFGFWTLDQVLRNFFTYGIHVLCFSDPQNCNPYNQFITRGVNNILSVSERCFSTFCNIT